MSESVLTRIKYKAWPDFTNNYFLNLLDKTADEAYSKNTIEGYLSSLLIYQQLCEELLSLILEDTHFLIEISIIPFDFPYQKKKKQTFGNLISDLNTTFSFHGKEEIINISSKINSLRTAAVHNLTDNISLEEIRQKLAPIQSLYHDLHKICLKTHDDFCIYFNDIRDDIMIE